MKYFLGRCFIESTVYEIEMRELGFSFVWTRGHGNDGRETNAVVFIGMALWLVKWQTHLVWFTNQEALVRQQRLMGVA